MKKIIACLLCLIIVFSVTGCGGNKTEKEISLLTLSSYMPEDSLKRFTENTGIAVKHTTVSSYDEMYTMIKNDPSAFDLVITCDYVLDSLTKENLLQEIDYKKFDNQKYVIPGYTGKYYDPDNKFTVPYAAIGVLIGYNPYESGIIIDSYADLLAPDLAGSVVFPDDASIVVGISNMAIEKEPNFYQTSMSDTGKIIRALKKNAYRHKSETAYPEDALINGDASVAVLYTMQLGYAVAMNPEIEIVYPKEGFIYSIDCMAIPSGADGKDYAMQFINFAHDPVENGKLAQEITYSSTNISGKQFMDEDYRNDGYNIKNDQAHNGVLFRKQTPEEANKFKSMYNEHFLEKTAAPSTPEAPANNASPTTAEPSAPTAPAETPTAQ